MSITNYIQPSFTSGELTPKLAGRTDLAKYKTGLATLYNFLISPYGCIYRRPGTKYVTQAQTSANYSRLVRFEYSNEQAYQLEFYAGGIRFYKDQGQILQSRDFTNGSFTTNIDGWTARNAGTGAIAYDTGQLKLTGGGAGNEARAYQTLANLGTSQYTVTLDVATNSITYRVGITAGGSTLGTGTLTTGTSKTFTFTPTTNTTIYIEFESTTTSRVDNVSLNSPIYQIDTSYAESDLGDLRFAQSFDTLYIVDQDHPPRQLQRLAHDNWVLSDIVFEEPPYMDINTTDVTLEPSDVTGSVTVTASTTGIFASTDVGRAIRFKGGPDRTNVTTYTGTGAQTYFDVPFFPHGVGDIDVNFIESNGSRTAKTYEASLTPGAGKYTILADGQVKTGDTASTSQRVEIAPVNAGSGEWGWGIITAYTDTDEVTVSIQRDLDAAVASTDWQLGAWSDTTGYPKVVVFHEQRLYFASTWDQPQTFWGSQIGNYTNFQPDNILYKGAVDNDTAVNFTLAANNSQAINWMSSKGALIIGTSNSVFSASATSGSISSSNIRVKKEADIPCDFQPIAETHNEVIFVEDLGQRVHSVHYSFQIDGYEVSELSLLSEHLGKESPIEEIVYQPTAKMLWARRADGRLLSCTYIRDQEVSGWARHTIGGTDAYVDSISVIPGAAFSELWMIVVRTIGGSDARYVEFMTADFDNMVKEDAVFLDSSATYSGSPTDTVSGLGHLEGETVQVLADGSVHPNVTVSSGAVTLNKDYSTVTFGYHKDSELETMSIESGSKIGSAQGSISRITEASLRFYETIGGEVGYDSANTDILQFREASDLMDSSPDLFTGFKIIKFPSGFNRTYKVYLKQGQPLPMTLLNIVFKAQVSDAQ